MDWKEILTLLVPVLGLMTWVYNRIEKKADERHKSILEELKSIKEKIHQMDMRLTRLEGRFDERGYWESREHYRTGTEDKH